MQADGLGKTTNDIPSISSCDKEGGGGLGCDLPILGKIIINPCTKYVLIRSMSESITGDVAIYMYIYIQLSDRTHSSVRLILWTSAT